ncbi:MAG: restriction endonuclease subunit S [Anaerolineae bacterium]|nr:restriction endonuclease subunit S [Anaerolineae bacterium]
MTHNWPMVSLGEVLTQSDEITEIELLKSYRRVTVKMWGQGAVLRDEVEGGQIAAKKQSVIRTNQFILSRIDARHGATAIVPESLNGAVVSNDFPSFNLNDTRILPKYLGWLSKTHKFVELCKAASEGTTNRVRLKLNRFLKLKISLPPLDEQRHIVARIEELAAKVEQTQSLREKSVAEVEGLWQSKIANIFSPQPEMAETLENVCEAIVDNLHSTPKYDGDEFPCLRSQDVGWGTINYTTARRTSEDEFIHRTRRGEPRQGDIVYVREGDVGRCGLVDGSQRFSLGQRVMMFRPNQKIVNSKFLMLQLMSPPVLKEQVVEKMTGTTSKHVNIKDLRKVRVNIPSLDEQRRILAYLDSLQAKVEAVKRHQAATAAKLDALLPSILDRAFKGEL